MSKGKWEWVRPSFYYLSCIGEGWAHFDFLSHIRNHFFPHNFIFLKIHFFSSLLTLTVHFSKLRQSPRLGPYIPFWLQLCRRWTVPIQATCQLFSIHCQRLLAPQVSQQSCSRSFVYPGAIRMILVRKSIILSIDAKRLLWKNWVWRDCMCQQIQGRNSPWRWWKGVVKSRWC